MTDRRARWILFDAADTLIYPDPGVADVYCQVASDFGLQRDPRVIKTRFGPAISLHFCDAQSSETLDRQRWQQLVFDVLQTDNEDLFDKLWDHFARPENWKLFDDVEETWQQLRRKGFNLAIASNFDGRLSGIVKASPTIRETKHLFISSQLGVRKPAIDFYRAIETRLGIDHAVMVGDNHAADVLGARRAGWTAYHLDRRAENLDPSNSGFTIPSLLTLVEKLDA